jgi:hypothetical protein
MKKNTWTVRAKPTRCSFRPKSATAVCRSTPANRNRKPQRDQKPQMKKNTWAVRAKLTRCTFRSNSATAVGQETTVQMKSRTTATIRAANEEKHLDRADETYTLLLCGQNGLRTFSHTADFCTLRCSSHCARTDNLKTIIEDHAFTYRH